MKYSVVLKAPLVANNGYGNSGFSLAKAFYQHGLETHLKPTRVQPPIPQGVAQLLVQEPPDKPDYFIHLTEPKDFGLSESEKRASGFKVLWSMWEFQELTKDLVETMTKRLDGYDLFLVYDEVSLNAFKPYADEAGVKIRIMQGGIDADEWKFDARKRDWSGKPFRFIMAGALSDRKNPFAAIHAFEEIKEEFPNAELHLKTNIQTLHPLLEQRYSGVKIHYDLWPKETLYGFYAGSQTYLALSWGEGLNLPALEAQLMGIPVIYSDVGGHRQWGDSTIGWPVEGTTGTHDGELHSFRVDHDSLVKQMRAAISDLANTRAKGEKAQIQIAAQCDWHQIVQKFLDTVKPF